MCVCVCGGGGGGGEGGKLPHLSPLNKNPETHLLSMHHTDFNLDITPVCYSYSMGPGIYGSKLTRV